MSRRLRKRLIRREENIPCAEYQEICRNVNCIPAGIYRVCEIHEECRIFSVGNKITFIVANADDSLFSDVDNERVRTKRTGEEEFLNSYYDLLEEYSRQSVHEFDPNRPITMCFVDPSLDRSLSKHSNFSQIQSAME